MMPIDRDGYIRPQPIPVYYDPAAAAAEAAAAAAAEAEAAALKERNDMLRIRSDIARQPIICVRPAFPQFVNPVYEPNLRPVVPIPTPAPSLPTKPKSLTRRPATSATSINKLLASHNFNPNRRY